MGAEGIAYKSGMSDFSKFTIVEVKIGNMTNIREKIGGQLGNYEQADAVLAEIWSFYKGHWTDQDLQKRRTDNLYT